MYKMNKKRVRQKLLNKEDMEKEYNSLIEESKKLRDVYNLATFQFLYKAYQIGKKIYGNSFGYERLAWDFKMPIKQVERILSLKKANKNTRELIKERKVSVEKVSIVLYCYNPSRQDELIQRLINENIKTYEIGEKFREYRSIEQRRLNMQFDAIIKGFNSKRSAFRSLKRLHFSIKNYFERYEGRISPKKQEEILNILNETESKIKEFEKELLSYNKIIPKRKRINEKEVINLHKKGLNDRQMAIKLGTYDKRIKLIRQRLGLKKIFSKFDSKSKKVEDNEETILLKVEYSKIKERANSIRDIYTIKMFGILKRAYEIGKQLHGSKFSLYDLARDFDMSYFMVNRIFKLKYANEKTIKYIQEGKLSAYKINFIFSNNGKCNTLFFQDEIVEQIVKKGLTINDIKKIVQLDSIEEIESFEPTNKDYKEIPFIGLINRIKILGMYAEKVSPGKIPNSRICEAIDIIKELNGEIQDFKDSLIPKKEVLAQ